MDCKDLMVGDWVICNHYQDKPFTKQFGVADFAKGEYEFCEPIPLTEDILVKNGWDFRDRQWAIECKEDERGIVELSRDKGGYYWSINWDEYLIIRIHYVHELQHILRLCGIEKELVID